MRKPKGGHHASSIHFLVKLRRFRSRRRVVVFIGVVPVVIFFGLWAYFLPVSWGLIAWYGVTPIKSQG